MKEIPVKNLSKILVTRTDRIGDLVLSTPVFSALRKQFPTAWITCLTFCENREIVEGNPYLDEVILYDKKGTEKGVAGNLRFARFIAAKKFDTVIHLHATNRMHWISWLAGIPVRIGYDRKSSWTLTHRVLDKKREGLKHEAEYNFDLLQLLKVERPESLSLYFPLKDSAERSLRELMKHYNIPQDTPKVILNPSASCPSKRWPADRFGYLVNKIANQYEATFIAIGTKQDRSFVQEVQKHASFPVFDLSGRLSLAMLGSLMKQSSLLISNDSGPVHVANAVGTPAISIFGRKQMGLSPTRWRPLDSKSRVIWKDVGCETCLAHRCQIQFLCLDAITVDDVLSETQFFEDRLKSGVTVS